MIMPQEAGHMVTIIVAVIAAIAAVGGAWIGRLNRSENRSDHHTVSNQITELQTIVKSSHSDNLESHDVIREDIRHVADRLDRHLQE